MAPFGKFSRQFGGRTIGPQLTWLHGRTCRLVLDGFGQRGQQLRIAFEQAERISDLQERRRQLTFVVVGGGPHGR
jgi:hypothetical protein